MIHDLEETYMNEIEDLSEASSDDEYTQTKFNHEDSKTICRRKCFKLFGIFFLVLVLGVVIEH